MEPCRVSIGRKLELKPGDSTQGFPLLLVDILTGVLTAVYTWRSYFEPVVSPAFGFTAILQESVIRALVN